MTTPSTRNGHGTRACYLRGCRRPECSSAHARYCKEYDLDRYRQGGRRVDSAVAAQHVQQLVAAGCTISGIVDATRTSHYTIVGLVNGSIAGILPDTERRILAFQPQAGDAALGHWADATGTRRRIQALAVLGHPIYAAADALGVPHATLRHIASSRNRNCSKSVAAAVADLYAQWMTRPGPSDITRRRAAAHNWHGPLAWDDIDNPDEQPDTDGVATPRALKKRTQPEEIAAEVRHLAGLGESVHFIAKQLGRSEKRISQLMPGYGEAA